MIDFDKDLKFMLKDAPGSKYWSHSSNLGSFSGYGLLEYSSEWDVNSNSITTIKILIIAKSDLPNPNPLKGQSIAVGTDNFTLNGYYEYGDNGSQYKLSLV